VLAQLKWLDLNGSQITDDGCAQLASWLLSGAMPALEDLSLNGTPLSQLRGGRRRVRGAPRPRPGLPLSAIGKPLVKALGTRRGGVGRCGRRKRVVSGEEHVEQRAGCDGRSENISLPNIRFPLWRRKNDPILLTTGFVPHDWSSPVARATINRFPQ